MSEERQPTSLPEPLKAAARRAARAIELAAQADSTSNTLATWHWPVGQSDEVLALIEEELAVMLELEVAKLQHQAAEEAAHVPGSSD